MNTNGRSKIEQWNEAVWQDIDKAVQEETARLRVSQKIFPSMTLSNGYPVPADIFDSKTMTIQEDQTKPFMEISLKFALTESQIEKEGNLKTGRTLARLAVKSAILAEDMLLFQGAGAKLPEGIDVTGNNPEDKGLLGLVPKDATIKVSQKEKSGVYGEETFRSVAKGISQLISKGQPGPYALVLESSVYADTYAPLPTTLITTADRLIPLMTGGFYGTGTIPAFTGLLVSLGGEPTNIYIGQDAITDYTQRDPRGMYQFRVFERIQYVARDPRAFVKLEFASS